MKLIVNLVKLPNLDRFYSLRLHRATEDVAEMLPRVEVHIIVAMASEE